MKKIMGVICFALTLCVAQNITVCASELNEDEFYIYYDSGVYDKASGEFFPYEDNDDDTSDGDLDSSDNNNSSDGESVTEPSLSDKHLEILDKLGSLLDYVPTGDEEEVYLDDDDFEIDFSSESPSDYELIEDIASNVSAMSDIMLLSQYDTYYGSISSTYLEYMRGFLGKLPFNYHYVAYRQSQYVYSFIFGDDLSYANGYFSGSNVTHIAWDTRNNGSYNVSSESSFGLTAGTNMVYTDLGTDYPSLMQYGEYQAIQLKWIILITVLSLWMISLYKGYRKYGDKDKKYAHVNSK